MEQRLVEDRLVKQVVADSERVGLDKAVGLKILNLLLTESKRIQGAGGRTESTSLSQVVGKAIELQRSGVVLDRLDVGEPDFAPPQTVLQACSDALFAHKTHYTEPRGIPELREALRKYLARKSHFDASDQEVAVTPSGRFAIYAALATVVGEGESAVVLEPNWPAYRETLSQIGARADVVHTSLEEGWTPTLEMVEEAVRPSTKALILSYPNNPTGRAIPAQLFKSIVEMCDEKGVTVISDEIYNEYALQRCPSVLETTPKKFVLTSSFSKTWAMTGFRIGYAVSSSEEISKISKLTSLMFTSVPEFVQWGAIKALDADDDARRNVSEMRRRIDAACRELDRIGRLEYARSDGAMYLFPGIRNPKESGDSFSQKLLAKGVSVVPGNAFGDYPRFFRISLGNSEKQIVEGIRRMGEVLA